MGQEKEGRNAVKLEAVTVSSECPYFAFLGDSQSMKSNNCLKLFAHSVPLTSLFLMRRIVINPTCSLLPTLLCCKHNGEKALIYFRWSISLIFAVNIRHRAPRRHFATTEKYLSVSAQVEITNTVNNDHKLTTIFVLEFDISAYIMPH